MDEMFPQWVIDLSMPAPDGAVCFIPYEPPDTFVVGMNVVSDKCPGKLVGIMHPGGQDAVEKWERDNPDWHAKYSSGGEEEG